MEFRVLGALEVRNGDGPLPLGGAKQRTVLAHLVLRANATVPAERLIDEVWGDEPPAAVRNVLQTYVSRLRKTLGPHRLEHGSGGYVLRARPEEIDARRFEALVVTARRTAASDPAAAIELYREADGLWRGPALDDLAGQASLRGEIAQLEERRIAAAEQRIVAALAAGRHLELVPELEALIAQHPLREALWSHLMVALYRSGRQADALAAYRRAREILVGELGIEPSAELRALEQQVLRQDPALEPDGRPLRGFQLLERVGAGSFGVVHRALQPQVGREVAVKVIRPALANEPEFIRRFEVEAQLVARLEHPHVVPLYDYWRDPDGAYLVMRYLRGGSLRDLLADGPLPAARALAVAGQVASALAAAHRQGVVHRDVKPANVLLDEEGNAYLSDFGIARDVAVARTPERADTASSAYYLSPEEARGEAPTARADVYSLGVVLFEMLTGRHPFAGLTPEAMATARVPPLGDDAPAGLAAVVERATARDPAARHADAAALAVALAGSDRAVVATAGPARNPYKGLRPFLEADAGDFHGREALVARLRPRLAATRLLALVGPSGSGKSSVAHAGLVPALRAEGWFVARMQPGSDPMAELATALEGLATTPLGSGPGLLAAAARELPGPDAELLLVVDQFEELFTLADEDARDAFLAELTAPSRAHVLLTLRADALDRPLARPGFAEIMSAGIELVLPMGPDELERAITGPAAGAGVVVEPGLVSALVTDVVGQPGALPLLQFTLAELFDHRSGAGLSLADYRELGGVAAAVARGAEDAYAGLGEPAREAARRLFLTLVDLGDGGTVRRRVARAELIARDGDATAAALDAFAARRLLSHDRDPETRAPTVEIAHDALLDAWERLRDWVAAAGDDLRTQHRLAAAAREWVEADRDPSFLLRGARLERLAAWRGETTLALTPAEDELLEASLAAEAALSERELAAARRTNRRLRALLAGGLVALVGAGVAGLVALDQRGDARRSATVAEAERLGAQALTVDETDRALLLARTGVALEDSVATRGNLLAALQRVPRGSLGALPDVRDNAILGMAVSPRGDRIAIGDHVGEVRLFDARTRRELASYRLRQGLVQRLAFSPDGTTLAVAGHEPEDEPPGALIDVLDARTLQRRQRIVLPPPPRGGVAAASPVFTADGRALTVVQFPFQVPQPQAVFRVDLDRGAVAGRPFRFSGRTLGPVYSSDRRRLFVTSEPEDVTYELDTADLRVIARHPAGGSAVALHPDEDLLAVGAQDGSIRFVALPSGRVSRVAGKHDAGISAMRFSPDGRTLISGDLEGGLIVWDAEHRDLRERLDGHAGEVGTIVTTPDGRTAISSGFADGKVAFWDLGDSRRLVRPVPLARRFEVEDPSPRGIAVSPDDRTLAVTQDNGTVELLDTSTLAPRAVVEAFDEGPALTTAFSPDGGLLAVGGDKGALGLWDARTLAPVRRLEGLRGWTQAVAFSPNGRLVAAGDNDGEDRWLRIWDVRSGRPTAFRSEIPTMQVEFSPGGRLLAAAGGDRGVEVRDVASGRLVAKPPLDAMARSVAFSPGGTLLFVGLYDGTGTFLSTKTWKPSGPGIRGHGQRITNARFTPDGRTLTTSSADGTVQLWDVASRRTIGAPLVVERDQFVTGVISRDGAHLYALPTGTEGMRLPLAPRLWGDLACAIAGRELTRREWDEVLPHRPYREVCAPA